MFLRSRLALGLALSAALLAAPAMAADFSINPTRVELGVKKGVETITLSNGEDRELSFEVSLMKWSQKDNGEWVEVASKDLVVYPALLKMPANGKGIVRIGAKIANAPAVEGSYRLSIQELPGGPAPDGTAVRLLTRVSLPVFITPAQKTEKFVLAANASKEGLKLTIANQGTVHASPQEALVEFLDGSGKSLGAAVKSKNNTDYVLPGASTSFTQAWPTNCSAVKQVKVKLADLDTLTAPVNGSCQ